jgi:anaerobic ribonucleoside-triphosphate reductase
MTTSEYLKQHEQERTKCECWSRAMGFLRPTSFFNIGKKQEFKDRKLFLEKVVVKHLGDE